MTTSQGSLNQAFTSELTCWVTWPDGEFSLEIRYLSSVDRDRMVKECQVRTFDRGSRQTTEVMDEKKFKRKLADLIVAWKDLNAKKARKFVAIKQDVSDNEEFPCTPENRLFAIDHFSGFPSWILDQAMELHTLQEKKAEEEQKNL